MKRLKVLIIVFTLFFLQSCSDIGCNENCFTPPNTFVFELVDSETGENLFTNGTLSRAGILVNHSESGASEDFTFYDQEDLNLLVLHTIGWETEIIELDVTVGTTDVFSIYVDSERVSDDCCAFTEFNEIRIESANYEYLPNSNIYKILLDLD